MKQASHHAPKNRNFSSITKHNNVSVHHSKQCPTCKIFIVAIKYQQHIQKCALTNKLPHNTPDPKRQTGYSLANQSNKGRILMKKQNSTNMQQKYNSSKPLSNYRTSKVETDPILKRKMSARVTPDDQKIVNQLKIEDQEVVIKQAKMETENNPSQEQNIQDLKVLQQRGNEKKEEDNDQHSNKQQVKVQKQESELVEQIPNEDSGESPDSPDNQLRQSQVIKKNSRIRVRALHKQKISQISHQVRMTEVNNYLIKKYNENPERIESPTKNKKSQDFEMSSENKSRWDKQRQRQRQRQIRMQRERERERQRQKALQRQRDIKRQKAEEEQRQKREQEERIRRQQRQQRNQIRQLQNQPNLISENINVHPVYNQTLHNLFLLASVANDLINYIENYALGDVVVYDMLNQVRNLNRMISGISENIVEQNAVALTMVNTYARRSQQIQEVIFKQLQIVLISNLSEYNDQQLIQQIRENIGRGISNIANLQFPILPVHSSSQVSKFTVKQIEEIFPPRLAIMDHQCSICLDDVKRGSKIKQLQCKHVFHPGCIDDWLLQSRKCPLCRQQQLIES